MPPQTEITKLINYIEENLRTTTKTKTTFIDPQGFLDRLKTKQNHVVFGRRGAGKSLLTTSLLNDDSDLPPENRTTLNDRILLVQ